MEITNSDTIKELQEAAGLQFAMSIPKGISETIIPTIEINPKLLRNVTIVRTASLVNGTAATIYTTPIDQDFYLTYAQVSLIKNAINTGVQTYLSCTPFGEAAATLLRIAGLTTTAQTSIIAIPFIPPIRLARNTTITINNDTGDGAISAGACIAGFIDNIKK